MNMQLTRIAIFFVCAIFVFNGCASEYKQSEDEKNLPAGRLVIYDSLTVATNSILFLSDYDDKCECYLFYDYFNGDIQIINRSGEKIQHFNRRGSGNTEYGELRGLSFQGDSNIIAFGPWEYYIYERSGRFIENSTILNKSILINPQFDFRALHFSMPDSSLALFLKGSENAYGGNPFYPDYYDMLNWGTVYHPGKEKAVAGVPLSSNSPNRKRFFKIFAPQFAINQQQQLLYVVFPYDPVVYIYQLPDLSFSKAVALQPTFFKAPQGIPFSGNQTKMNDEAFRESQLSGEYMSVQALKNNLFLTYYLSGLEEDIIAEDMSAYLEAGLDRKRAKYIQIFDLAGNKIYRDIALPGFVKGFVMATDLNHIVLLADTPDELGFSMYYLAALNIVD